MADSKKNAEIVINPMASLARMMGLTPELISKLADLPTNLVMQALADPADGLIEAYVRIGEVLGVHYRLRRAAPVMVAIDLYFVDALYHDNIFRKQRGLLALPRCRGALGALVKKMRTDGRSESYVADLLTKSHVCTRNGASEWDNSAVRKLVKQKVRRPTDALVPEPETLARWHTLLIAWIMAEASGADPFFQIRYGVQHKVVGRHLYIRTTEPITEKPRQWFLERLATVWWIRKFWRVVEVVPEGPKPTAAAVPEEGDGVVAQLSLE